MNLKGSQTEKNHLAAFAGESQARNRYTYFAGAARNEGYEQISAIFLEAESFARIAEVEQFHERRYRALLKNVNEGSAFKKKSSTKWHCRNCGNIHEGAEAPRECPACRHPQSYYEVLAENW
ncbi:MAG: hypothetical protein OIN88_01705 [Candidatus Methanoperedens sp.]|nr:hypothetical protein [Candidatus Methanoperedens sp.]